MNRSGTTRASPRTGAGWQERARLVLSRMAPQGGGLRELWLRHGRTRRLAAARNWGRSPSKCFRVMVRTV